MRCCSRMEGKFEKHLHVVRHDEAECGHGNPAVAEERSLEADALGCYCIYYLDLSVHRPRGTLHIKSPCACSGAMAVLSAGTAGEGTAVNVA